MADANRSDRHPVVPEDATIILPIRNVLLFPGLMLPLAIDRPSSIAAAQEAVRTGSKIGLLLQDDPDIERPGPEHLRRSVLTAEILRYVTADQTHHIICRGLRRFRVEEFLSGFPFPVARIKEIGISEVITPDIEARMHLLKARAREAHPVAAEFSGRARTCIESLELAIGTRRLHRRPHRYSGPRKQDLLETFD